MLPSSPIPVCRPALPSDRTDVLQFTRFIWDGHDYIQYVWDDWLADPRGLLAVTEYAGHAVALGKATCVAEGQWWLEGLRVDPKLQGLKIGSHIFEYLDNWWAQHAGGAFRLMTSSERVQVHHLCERFGWDKIGEVKAWEAGATAGERHPFRPVAGDGIAGALRFASANLDYCWGLADLGWKFGTPDRAMLDAQARERRLYRSVGSAWQDFGSPDETGSASGTSPRFPASQAVIAYWEDEDEGRRTMGISFVACALDALTPTLGGIRRLAGELGFATVLWHAPFRAEVEAALTAAGFQDKWPGSAWLFGKER